MNVLRRIKEYLDYKGIRNSNFEKSIGYSNGAFASQLKNNRTIGVDKLEKILSVYKELNPIWVLTGTGDMIIDTKNRDEVSEERPEYIVLKSNDEVMSRLDQIIEQNIKKIKSINAFFDENGKDYYLQSFFTLFGMAFLYPLFFDSNTILLKPTCSYLMAIPEYEFMY